MTGGEKPGPAKADQWRDKFDKGRRESELAIERLRYRAELRSEHEDEDTGVIHRVADERVAQREGSIPAPAKGIKVVLSAVDSWQKVAALLILVVGLLAGYWLRSR